MRRRKRGNYPSRLSSSNVLASPQASDNENPSENAPDGTPENTSEHHSEDAWPRRPQKSARDKVMDFLARRNHSEVELRQKLSRHYGAAEIDEAIAFARDNNWMLPEEELSSRVAIELGRKKKGHRYINQFLKAKGLPAISRNWEEEVEKAAAIAQAKLDKGGGFDYEEQRKIYRLLSYRGFDDETIRHVIHQIIGQKERSL